MHRTPGRSWRNLFPCSLQDLLTAAGILLCAVGLCILLRTSHSADSAAVLIFVLAVLLISRLTTGYLFGLMASFLGVIGVNYIFTYPYLELNFTLSGYPLTFFTMLVVSILTSAMTTQIKQQEHLRTESEKEKMRANLLRSVSHDIRTPLTSIVGATSAVLDNQETLSDDQKRRLLEDVRDDGQWLIRVVENLLSITRMGNDRAEIVKEREAAEEVLEEAVRKFRKRLAGMSGLTVEVTVPEELLLVPMDAILIEQVLSNLLENAATHGQTTAHIRLSVQREDAWAVFAVEDDGQGISREVLPVLFDGTLKHNESHRGDGKRSMGLGLSVCLAIVRAHGGTMTGHNLESGGAEFIFRLPLEEERTHEDPR